MKDIEHGRCLTMRATYKDNSYEVDSPNRGEDTARQNSMVFRRLPVLSLTGVIRWA